MRERLARLTARQWAGVVLFIVGTGFTAALAFRGGGTEPPSSTEQAMTTLLAIGAQGGAVWAFSGTGRADPGLARSAVSRLARSAQRAAVAKEDLETLFELDPPAPAAQLRRQIGKLSVTASYLEEGFLEAMEDWRIFHPQVVQEVENRGTEA